MGFQLDSVFPGLTYHFVARVILPDGKPAVLKISPKPGGLEREVQCLSLLTCAVPSVLANFPAEDAYLMQEISPGFPLNLPETESLRVVAKIICDLSSKNTLITPLVAGKIPHLRSLLPDIEIVRGRLDLGEWERLSLLADRLTIPSSEDKILHGDLHHGNILSYGSGWAAIDPHGFIGNPLFEVGSLFYNPSGKFSDHRQVENYLDSWEQELGSDRAVICEWAYLKIWLSVAWQLQDHGVWPEQLVHTAQLLGDVGSL